MLAKSSPSAVSPMIAATVLTNAVVNPVSSSVRKRTFEVLGHLLNLMQTLHYGQMPVASVHCTTATLVLGCLEHMRNIFFDLTAAAP